MPFLFSFKTSEYNTNRNSLDPLWLHLQFDLIQPIQIIPPPGLQIHLDVKMRIRILLVHPLAFLHNAMNRLYTVTPGLVVRARRILPDNLARGDACGLCTGIRVIRKYRVHFPRKSRVEVFPELLQDFLWGLVVWSAWCSAARGRNPWVSHISHVVVVVHGPISIHAHTLHRLVYIIKTNEE